MTLTVADPEICGRGTMSAHDLIRLGVWGSVVSSPSGVRGRAPGANDFWLIWIKFVIKMFYYFPFNIHIFVMKIIHQIHKNFLIFLCAPVPYPGISFGGGTLYLFLYEHTLQYTLLDKLCLIVFQHRSMSTNSYNVNVEHCSHHYSLALQS
mgnify:CR=1 FL=1